MSIIVNKCMHDDVVILKKLCLNIYPDKTGDGKIWVEFIIQNNGNKPVSGIRLIFDEVTQIECCSEFYFQRAACESMMPKYNLLNFDDLKINFECEIGDIISKIRGGRVSYTKGSNEIDLSFTDYKGNLVLLQPGEFFGFWLYWIQKSLYMKRRDLGKFLFTLKLGSVPIDYFYFFIVLPEDYEYVHGSSGPIQAYEFDARTRILFNEWPELGGRLWLKYKVINPSKKFEEEVVIRGSLVAPDITVKREVKIFFIGLISAIILSVLVEYFIILWPNVLYPVMGIIATLAATFLLIWFIFISPKKY